MVEPTSWSALQEQYASLLFIAEENNKKSLSQVSSLEEIIAKQQNDQKALQQSIEDLCKRLETKGTELQRVTGERDQLAEDKKIAQQELQRVAVERDQLAEEKKVAQQELQRVAVERDQLAEEKKIAQQELERVAVERDAHAKEKEAAQKGIEKLNKQMQAKEAELQKVAGERNARAKEKEEAREEAELTLLQLHQVQGELESIFIADQAKQKQVDELKQQMSAGVELMKALEKDLTNEKEEIRKEAELAFLQLHQVQEELEYNFQKGRSTHQLVDAQRQELERSKSLISALIQQPDMGLLSIRQVDVEVLPPEYNRQTNIGPAETEALIDSYKKNLQRAADLLKKKYGT